MAQLTVNLNELGIFSGCYESIWLHSETNLEFSSPFIEERLYLRF